MLKDWVLTGASVIGPSHISKQMPNQDAFLYKEISPTVTVMAVSDGHGGKLHPQSHIGSQTAVTVAVELIESYYRETLAEQRVNVQRLRYDFEQTLSKEIHVKWQKHIRELDDYTSDVAYGCTLLACLVTEDILVMLQIGDGKAVVILEDGTIFYPVHHDARFAVNETASLAQANAWAEMVVAMIEHPRAMRLVALSTDGVENAYPENLYDDHVFYKSLYEQKHTVDALVTMASMYSKDDTTTVCLYHTGASSEINAQKDKSENVDHETEALDLSAPELWIAEVPEGWRFLSDVTNAPLNKRIEMAYRLCLEHERGCLELDAYATLKQMLYHPEEDVFYKLYGIAGEHPVEDATDALERLVSDLIGEAFQIAETESVKQAVSRLQRSLYYDYAADVFKFKGESKFQNPDTMGFSAAEGTYEIFFDSEIYLHQLMPLSSTVDSLVGEVVQHPKHTSVWGLVNKTKHIWEVHGSSQTQVYPGRTLTLLDGITVFIYGIPVHIKIMTKSL